MNALDGEAASNFVETAVGGERVPAFIPPALPRELPFDLVAHQQRIEQANQALGRLDGVASILPDTPLFLYMYVRKEALLSSQIEGTQSSLSDLLLYENEEAPGVPLDDVGEVSNYVAAMNHGLRRLYEGFPLSLRLIREMHEILLRDGRGAGQQPGEFRRSQNWIGGTRPGNAIYVPPPPQEVMRCMGDLEIFLQEETPTLPTVVKAGLAHVQFESIHPFLDGNGRLGRLLITLYLCERGVLKEPVLYLSLFLKTHRQEYYDNLQKVRREADWSGWLDFFLTGVIETAGQATEAARRILTLFATDRKRVEALGRPASSALRVHDILQSKPMTTVRTATAQLGLTQPTVASALRHLEELGIVREITGRSRGRIFVYSSYLAILNEGTEPLPR